MADPVPANAAAARVDAATAAAVASEASIAETREVIENSAVAAAEARVEQAEDAAEDIALAALHTQLGQQISGFRAEVIAWQDAHEQKHQAQNAEMATLQSELMALSEKIMATQPVAAAVIAAPSSNLPGSPPEVIAAVVGTVEPTVAPPAGAVQEVPATKKKIRLI